jgi:ATP-dependent Clp protease ATP-binding subunit ClpB
VPAGQYLDKFTKDLTKLARDGKLDPVIGREDEIRRTIQVLSRRTKNNPVLYGEPGMIYSISDLVRKMTSSP